MIEFIRQFVKDELNGDIDELLYYDLARLRGNDIYGCNKREFDCDDTNIARAIYSVVFVDVWPDLTYESFSKKQYRGDTINTFNTLFGRIIDDEIRGFDRMVLPNLLVGKSSLNLYRGCHPIWRDYIDRFLSELRNILK